MPVPGGPTNQMAPRVHQPQRQPRPEQRAHLRDPNDKPHNSCDSFSRRGSASASRGPLLSCSRSRPPCGLRASERAPDAFASQSLDRFTERASEANGGRRIAGQQEPSAAVLHARCRVRERGWPSAAIPPVTRNGHRHVARRQRLAARRDRSMPPSLGEAFCRNS